MSTKIVKTLKFPNSSDEYVINAVHLDGVTATATELNYTDGVTSNIQTQLNGKLGKTTYEYNKELALGSSGKVCIGKFPMYDSNISVEIKSTTSTTYNGTLVIATQNINTTGGGSYYAAVYGDASNTLTNSIKIKYASGSNVFEVYIDLPGWSKNLLHIQCVALAGTPTDIATTVTEIPSAATIVPTNVLKSQFDAKQATITGGATTITSSNLTANRALISNGSGKVAVSDITSTELGYLDGVTSNIQTQLNGKANSSQIPTSLKNPNALTINVNGTNTAYDGSSAKTVNITAASLGLEQAMKFLGSTTTAISDGSTTKTITVNSSSITVTNGNVVLYNGYEYVWTGEAWEQLGQEGSFSLKTHTHGVTTKNAAPHTHTHTVTVSGNTGANSGNAVTAVTGYGSFSGGSGSLTSNTTATDGIKYVEAVTHSASTLTGTKTFNTDAIKGVSLSASTTSTDGPAYVASISGGSGSLKSYDAATNGTAKTSSGRVPYIADVTHTPASLTGTTTFVTSVSGGSGSLTSNTTSTNGIKYVEAQGTFSAGTTPVSSAAPSHTSTTSGANSGTAVTAVTGVAANGTATAVTGVAANGTATVVSASVNNGVLTLTDTTVLTGVKASSTATVLTGVKASSTATVAPSGHTHSYDKTTGITLTRGTAPSLAAATTKYLHHTHTGASSGGTGTVGISGGSISKTTYYLDHAHTAASATTRYMKVATTAASTGTVGISSGTPTVTTKYLHHAHTGAALGSASTASVAPSGHTHSYGSSTALTTSANNGSAVAAVITVDAANS